MKTIWIGIVLTFLAMPALAIGQGECCSKVNGVCISTCNKSFCSGQGDCDLAFTWFPGNVDTSHPDAKHTLVTLENGDRQTLNQVLVAQTDAQPSGERPDGGPILFLDVVDELAYPKPDGVPEMLQTGGTTAFVPMKHGSCGIADCSTHVLASQDGNLDVPFKLRMTCPAGTTVTFFAYQFPGQNQAQVVTSDTGSASFEDDVAAQPYSKLELEQACQTAMGGAWVSPGSHNNGSKLVPSAIGETVQVWGQCSGWANSVKRSYPVYTSLTCSDESWPPSQVP